MVVISAVKNYIRDFQQFPSSTDTVTATLIKQKRVGLYNLCFIPVKQHICVWWVNSTVFIFVWTVPLPLTWMKWYDQVFVWRVSVSTWVCLWLNNPTSTHHWRWPYLVKCPVLRTPPPSSPPSHAFDSAVRRSSIRSARSWLRWRLRSDSRTGSRWTATEEARPLSCTPNTPLTSPAAEKYTHNDKMQYIYCISGLV